MIINATKDPNIQPISRGGTGATTVAGARNALGLGNTSGAVPIANGGTGATSVAGARNALGLGNTSGAVPVANGGTGATTASGARANLGVTVANLGLSGAETKTLLWTNASPGSSFASQTIPGLDASGYDAIEIITRANTSDATRRIDRVMKGEVCWATFVWNARYVRAISFNSGGTVTVKEGNKSSSVTTSVSNDNSAVIPLKIYGIKGV